MSFITLFYRKSFPIGLTKLAFESNYQPDLTAPGVNILAAWSPVRPESISKRSTPYNIQSGTSAAAAHIAGAAAYIKANHPSWSAAALKSALMTTGNQEKQRFAQFPQTSWHNLCVLYQCSKYQGTNKAQT